VNSFTFIGSKPKRWSKATRVGRKPLSKRE